MSFARHLAVAVALGVLSMSAPAAAQRELLVAFPVPGATTERVIVTARTPGASARSSVTEWIVPSNGSGESPNVSLGIVRRARAAPTTFTLVTETAACVVTSRRSAVVFAGITASGETLSARIVSVAACGAPAGALALAGSHPTARLTTLHEDVTARAQLPTTLSADQMHQSPLTAPGLPFIVLGGYEGSVGIAYAYCGTTLLAQRPAYARSLLTMGARTFLVAQPVAFADGALWRAELVPITCP